MFVLTYLFADWEFTDESLSNSFDPSEWSNDCIQNNRLYYIVFRHDIWWS